MQTKSRISDSMRGDDPERLIAAQTAAERLGVSKATLLSRVHDGSLLAEQGINARRIGRKIQIVEADVDRFITEGPSA